MPCVCVCLWRCGSFGWLYVCASECTQCLPLHVGMGLRSCRGQGHIMRVRASARSCESQPSPEPLVVVHRPSRPGFIDRCLHINEKDRTTEQTNTHETTKNQNKPHTPFTRATVLTPRPDGVPSSPLWYGLESAPFSVVAREVLMRWGRALARSPLASYVLSLTV